VTGEMGSPYEGSLLPDKKGLLNEGRQGKNSIYAEGDNSPGSSDRERRDLQAKKVRGCLDLGKGVPRATGAGRVVVKRKERSRRDL